MYYGTTRGVINGLIKEGWFITHPDRRPKGLIRIRVDVVHAPPYTFPPYDNLWADQLGRNFLDGVEGVEEAAEPRTEDGTVNGIPLSIARYGPGQTHVQARIGPNLVKLVEVALSPEDMKLLEDLAKASCRDLDQQVTWSMRTMLRSESE